MAIGKGWGLCEMLKGVLAVVPSAQGARLASAAVLHPRHNYQTQWIQTADQKQEGLCPERKGTLQALMPWRWPLAHQYYTMNKRKSPNMRKISALQSLLGHHTQYRFTQAETFCGKLEARLMRVLEGSARRQGPHLQWLQRIAAIYRFQCSWDTLCWDRRINCLKL